ncbi:MAG: cytochrome-c peroxidase [Bacteroidia bacterium]
MPQSPENPVTIEGADLGRHLFYDPILSKNYNMSCATCHKQEKAFSDAPNAFTKGNNGVLTKRNTMPLFNLAWYPSFFWDGRAASIEEQVFHPVRDLNEMNLNWKDATNRINRSKFYKQKFKLAFPNQEIDSVLISRAIGQFLRTLISNNSKFDRVLAGEDYLDKDEFAGLILMNDMTKGDCLHCHTSDADALGTTGLFSNNGLDNIKDPKMYKDKGLGGYTNNENDNGKFKIPSLRNVAVTAPYMHDGRFVTLEEVLDFYSEGVKTSVNIDSKMGLAHQGGVRLTKEEKKQIIAFLKTLTDSTFITNPNFGNPFKQ